MKNLLIKKSFLKLFLFMLAFSSIFLDCNPGGKDDGIYATISGVKADGTPLILAQNLYLPFGKVSEQSLNPDDGSQIKKVTIEKVGVDPTNTPLQVYFNGKVQCEGTTFRSCTAKYPAFETVIYMHYKTN